MNEIWKDTRFPAAILGNGPSMRSFDFRNGVNGYVTFGMNAAYRYWDKIGWYPNYYSCLDINLGLSHIKEISRLIQNSHAYGIRGFLLREVLIKKLGTLGLSKQVVSLRQLFKRFPDIFRTLWISTGSHTALWAATLGYKRIILLGIDCCYVEILPEAKLVRYDQLVITSTPSHNPNYFFDDYQQEGDIYSIPNPGLNNGNSDQLTSWANIKNPIMALNSIIVNANLNSALDIFPKYPFDKALDFINKECDNRINSQKAYSEIQNFPLNHSIEIDEVGILEFFLPKSNGIMLDLGAHYGGSSLRFLKNNWKIYACEPDPDCCQYLKEIEKINSRLSVIDRAITATSDNEHPWFHYIGLEHLNGIQYLNIENLQNGTVLDISINDCISKYNIGHIDFLNISICGFEYFAIKNFPFSEVRPKYIIVEYNNQFLIPLGFSAIDIIEILISNNYKCFLSKYYKKKNIYSNSKWCGIFPFPTNVSGKNCCGKIIAFANSVRPNSLISATKIAYKNSDSFKSILLHNKTVYFWGCGDMYFKRRHIFSSCKPIFILTETDIIIDNIDGIPVKHPDDVLPNGQLLPIIIFAGEDASEQIKKHINIKYPRFEQILVCSPGYTKFFNPSHFKKI